MPIVKRFLRIGFAGALVCATCLAFASASAQPPPANEPPKQQSKPKPPDPVAERRARDERALKAREERALKARAEAEKNARAQKKWETEHKKWETETRIRAENVVREQAETEAHEGETRLLQEAEVAPMVRVPAGLFAFGCEGGRGSDEACPYVQSDPRMVDLPSFEIDRTPVIVAQYRQCVSAGVCSPTSYVFDRKFSDDGVPGPFVKGGTDRSTHDCNWNSPPRDGNTSFDAHPINCVDWKQADTYCRWVGKRLPTEEEWEKAARGTDARLYPWGSQWPPPSGRTAGRNVAVAAHLSEASPYGALDMCSNVREWTSSLPVQDDPSWLREKPEWLRAEYQTYRVTRGGPIVLTEYFTRTTTLFAVDPGYRIDDLGFRCAR